MTIETQHKYDHDHTEIATGYHIIPYLVRLPTLHESASELPASSFQPLLLGWRPSLLGTRSYLGLLALPLGAIGRY